MAVAIETSPESWSLLSWNTRISRTRVSTVDSLSLNAGTGSVVQSLGELLQTVKHLGLSKCQIEDIELEAPIGEGESFTVDRCRYKSQLVAVKHVKLAALKSDSHNYYRRLRTVLAEIQIMHHAPLREHPNVLSILGYGWKTPNQSPLPYIVVEYGEHGSLRSWLKDHSRFQNMKSKLILAGDVASGVTALHLCGIVHGDLKLDNIVVVPSWDRPSNAIAKLCDFGHSIILGDTSQRQKYYGTTLYNAPEVFLQDLYGLEPAKLHKCDIWAYGLLVWEIFAEGQKYFKNEWQRDSDYGVQSVTSNSSQNNYGVQSIDSDSTQDSNTKSQQNSALEYLESDNQQVKKQGLSPATCIVESVFGAFDQKHLRDLGRTFIKGLYFPYGTIEKAYLLKLIDNTLQVDPELRLSRITRLPVMVHWNLSSITSLQEKLAIYTGSASLSYLMFQPDEDRDLAWEHQCQMLQDFEKIALGKNIEDHSAAAALQAGFCYIAGFGAEIDHNNAVRFLKRSEELNHPVARLFGSTLESVIGNDVSDTGLNYANQVVLGFQWKALLKPSKFEVHFLELFPDGPVPTCTFEDHASYRAWLLAIPPETVPHLMHSHVVMVTTSSKMNHVELAIAMDDIDSVHFLETCFLPSGRGLNGKPFLIQAFEKGNFDMINTLLDFGADPQVTTEDGFTIYHWLFVLGQGAILIARRLRSAHHSSNLLLNTPCPASIVLHPQWPLEISGTPLASAITSGSIAAVQALLELGANPLAYVYSSLEVKDPRSGWTPFHLAMKYHSAEIIALLLQATGAKDPYKALQSVKRLNISADLGQCLSSSSIVERYAIHGKDHRLSLSNAVKTLPLRALEHVTKDGKTALMQAIDFSDLDVVKVLLQAHPGLAMKPFFDPQKESSFNYPAHFAAQISARHESVSSFEVLKFLVQDETVIQSLMDSHRRTLLHLAVTGSSSNTSQWLLDKGASHELTDMDGRAPIHYAGSAANVKLLLDAGAEVNMLDKFGLTPLHIAALAGSEELTRALINNDADITISSPRHGTPLHCGITRRSRIVIETILEAAKALNQDSAVIINCLNRDGDTALHTAIQTSRSDVVRVLLSFGADINVRNRNSGHTPLHQCVLSGDAEFIRWYMSMAILHENFDIDARDFQQRTPLHYAATIGHVEAAQMLLQRGAQVDARDSKGNTALNLVVAASDKAIRKRAGDRVLFISVLNSFGASLISENNKGQRAWDYAYSRIDFNLMILLLERGGPVACRNATLPGTETGNKLFDRALKESKWDFIKLLLSQIFLLRPTPTHNCLSEWITILDEKKLRVAGTKNEAEILSVLSLWIDRIDPKISGKVRNNMESTKAAERAVSDAHKIHPQLSNLEQRQISRLHTIFDAATTHAALCSLSAILLSNLTSLRNINLPLEECQQLKNFSFSGERLYYKPFEQLLQRGKSDSENSQFQYESWNCARIKKYSELVSQAKKCSRDDLKLAIFGLDSTVYDFSFRRYMTKAMAGLSFSQAQEQKNYTEIYLRAHNAERPAQSFSDDGQESDFVLATTLVKYLCEKNKTALKSLFMTLGQDENLCLTSEPPSPSFLSDEARNWLYKAW